MPLVEEDVRLLAHGLPDVARADVAVVAAVPNPVGRADERIVVTGLDAAPEVNDDAVEGVLGGAVRLGCCGGEQGGRSTGGAVCEARCVGSASGGVRRIRAGRKGKERREEEGRERGRMGKGGPRPGHERGRVTETVSREQGLTMPQVRSHVERVRVFHHSVDLGPEPAKLEALEMDCSQWITWDVTLGLARKAKRG